MPFGAMVLILSVAFVLFVEAVRPGDPALAAALGFPVGLLLAALYVWIDGRRSK